MKKLDLFNKLKNLWYESGRDISEFWINKEVDSTLDEILTNTLLQIDFKGEKDLLLKRVRKLASNQEFSIREKRLLKRLVEVQRNSGKLDFRQIEYFFPGKLSSIVCKEIGEALISL